MQQAHMEIGEQIFLDSIGFVIANDDSRKKEPDAGFKFLVQYQIRILDNLTHFLTDFYGAEIQRNQSLTNMSQARLMNIVLTPDQEFGLGLINSYN